MKRSVCCMLVVGLVLLITLVPGAYAQATKDAKSGLDRIDGYVVSIDKDKSALVVRQKSGTNITWNVAYNADTKFTLRNAPSKVDEVKENRRVIILGKFDEKNTLNAARIDVRTQ